MDRRFDIVFFDVGHTLIWFHPSVGEIIARAWTDIGLPISAERAEEVVKGVWAEEDDTATTVGFPATGEFDERTEYERSLRMLQRLGGTDEAMARAYHARVNQIFLEPGSLRLYEDVHPALAQIQSAGYRLGIISNWSWNLIDRCKQVGIDRYFEVIMASAYAGINKPHPRIFQQTLERVGVSADRAVHVGDRHDADVVGAQAAGMTGVLLDRKGEANGLDCPVVTDLWELVDWLEEQ